jgi:hypothetical protein
VGDQHVRIAWNLFPLGSDLRAARQVKGPIAESGLPRTSIETDPIDVHRLILQVYAVGEEFAPPRRLLFQAKVMVAGDDELMPMGKPAQELVKCLYLLQAPPAVRSPAWISRSPLGIVSRSCCPWVSLMATMRIEAGSCPFSDHP